MNAALEWKNWSGSVQARPSRLASPRTEDELATIVRGAAKVRVTGAGHSFMPLCATTGVLLSLAELDSPIEVAADRASAWVPAGWSLKRLTAALWDLGYSLPNQGDINPQSMAGATATGTHGTGMELGSLSTFARAYRMVLADGSIVECSKQRRSELFEAQRLALGLLGVATRIRVDIMPAFHLEERIERVPLAAAIEQFETVARTLRHAEFFVFPYADEVIMKTLHPVEEPGDFKEPSSGDETIFRFCCDVTAAAPAVARVLQRQLMRLIRSSRRTGPAHRVFPSERTVSFEEMEYEMPRAAGLDTLQEAIAWVRKRKLPVAFPFEFRWVAADDIWLSPFSNGPGASISMHQYSKMEWRPLLTAAEPIFRGNGGRPHWAKRHTLTTKDVFALYPKAERFCKVRAQVDPAAKFANAHLAELFGIGG
jgi:FAD-linked oxidoreductase